MRPARESSPESLAGLLGGRRSALDATAPAVAFGLGWILAERSLAWGAGAALVTGSVVAAVRWRRGGRPLAALLGVVVGGLLGQRTAWRRDPALLRAYRLASWVWVGQYVLRIAVFTPLWLAEEVVALVAARVALSWPLVAACAAVSGMVLVRALPRGHPGLRHPRTTGH